MTNRSTRRAERLRQVLDAAMAIIAEHGLEALTIARLAKRVDASVGGLYRYFASKEELLVQVEERAIASFYEDQRARMEDVDRYLEAGGRGAADDQPAALLRVIASVNAYLEDAEVAPTRHRLFDAFLSAPQPVLGDARAAVVEETLRPILATVARLLDAAAAAGALDSGDSMRRTTVLMAAIHGLDHMRKRDRIVPPNLRMALLLPETLGTLLRGWGASAAHVRETWDLAGGLPPATPNRDTGDLE